MPGQYNPMNPAGGLGPGQGFLSRGIQYGAPAVSTIDSGYGYGAGGGTIFTGQPVDRPASPVGPSPGFVLPGARSPFGPPQPPSGGYAPMGQRPGDFTGGPNATNPYSLAPSGPGAYGTGAAGSYVDAQGRPLGSPSQAPSPSGLSALAQMAYPGGSNTFNEAAGGMSPTLQSNNVLGVPGGTGPKPAGSSPGPGLSWADYGFVQQSDGSWVMPQGAGGTGGAGGGSGGGAGGGAPGGSGGAPGTPGGGSPGGDDWAQGGFGASTSSVGIPSIGELLQAMQGQRYPGTVFEGNDVFGLPGRSKAGEQVAQLIAQYLASQTASQAPRSSEAEGLVRGLASQGAESPYYLGAEEAVNAARGRLGDTAALKERLEREAYSRSGEAQQRSMQSLRDAGLFGRGGMGVDPTLAASNLANRGLSQDLLGIEQFMAQEEANRIAQLGGASTAGSNIYQALRAAPQTELANLLRQPANPAEAQLIDFLNQMAQTAVGGDVSFRAQPNDFERVGLPLILDSLDLVQEYFGQGFGNSINMGGGKGGGGGSAGGG